MNKLQKDYQSVFKKLVTERNKSPLESEIDVYAVCASLNENCFLEVNRGYKCQKHRGVSYPEPESFEATHYTEDFKKEQKTRKQYPV